MAKRNRAKVEKFYDRVAGIYDTIYDSSPYWDMVFEITWRHVLKFLPQDLSIRCLDIGCGTGRWGLRLTKSGYTTDFLDISLKMVDQVHKKLTRMDTPSRIVNGMVRSPEQPPAPGQTDEILCYQASVDDISIIPKESYDFIIGQGDPLNCAKRPDRTLKEFTRILKPGGIMMMSVDNRWAGIYHYFKEDRLDELKDFLKNGKTQWVTDEEAEQYEIIMFTPDQIRTMCEARKLNLLSMIGKTVLPLRRFRDMLKDRERRESLMKLEESLNTTEALLGNAAHLEFVAQKPTR